jgi:hypothetical protein
MKITFSSMVPTSFMNVYVDSFLLGSITRYRNGWAGSPTLLEQIKGYREPSRTEIYAAVADRVALFNITLRMTS